MSVRVVRRSATLKWNFNIVKFTVNLISFPLVWYSKTIVLNCLRSSINANNVNNALWRCLQMWLWGEESAWTIAELYHLLFHWLYILILITIMRIVQFKHFVLLCMFFILDFLIYYIKKVFFYPQSQMHTIPYYHVFLSSFWPIYLWEFMHNKTCADWKALSSY